MTIQDILDYISETPANSNINVLKTMVQQVAEADNPDLSGITAGADQILSGYKSVDKDGKEVTEELYKESCLNPRCDTYNQKYYNKVGKIVTKEEYQKECPLNVNKIAEIINNVYEIVPVFGLVVHILLYSSSVTTKPSLL